MLGPLEHINALENSRGSGELVPRVDKLGGRYRGQQRRRMTALHSALLTLSELSGGAWGKRRRGESLRTEHVP